MADTRTLPIWADDLRRRYLRGEASIFLLHGNVYDMVISGGRTLTLTDFLGTVLLKDSKETIAVYNVATGIRFLKRPKDDITNMDELLLSTEKPRVLAAIERLLMGGSRTAVILEYAEVLAPAGDPSFQSDGDRAAVVTLHRWSFLPEIERSDNVVILIAENLAELSPKLVSNPKVAVVDIPMPDRDTRKTAAALADKALSEKETDRYAEITAGLKTIQILSILTPPPASETETRDREAFISGILVGGTDVPERAHKLAQLTAGMSRDEITKLLAPGATPIAQVEADRADHARQEVDRLIARRKREIIERECFGLVEFVEPQHGFEVVGGMEEVKKDLSVIAASIRDGQTQRVPMGVLFTGPMGTGKTFVAEAFAKECGLTTIKLKNFRSKWVGATEGNLEKILNVIRAIGQVVVIIDEGDRAFGNTDGDGDGGTSSRVIARIKEFMSDTTNRGRILFLVMTNRPDKLDVDSEARRPPRPQDPVPLFADAGRSREHHPRRRAQEQSPDQRRLHDDPRQLLDEARRLQQRRHRSRRPHGPRRRRAREHHRSQRRPLHPRRRRLLPQPRRRAPRIHGAPRRLRSLQPPPPARESTRA